MDELLSSANFDMSEAELFKPRIAVCGVGGGGNNTVQRLSTLDVKGANLFAFNTDNKQLQTLNPIIKKIALGYSLTHGLGAGGFPDMGEKAAEISRSEIDTLLRDTNLLFLTAGMGGGTGTGAAPVVAQIAKENGAIVVGIVTIPFSLERSRLNTAKKGIERLRQYVDTLIVIDNQRLVMLYPNLQIEQAFKLADEITSRAVRGITEAITQPSMVNIDYADVRTIMQSGGLAMISVGSGQGANRVEEVVRNTLKNKLLDVEYEGATGVLLHITGGPDMTLGEANKIGEMLTSSVSPTASVTWGARLENDNQGRIDVIAIFTGVSSPGIFSGTKKDEERGLGLDIL